MQQKELEKIVSASQVFTPGAPVNSKQMFAGRESQLQRILETIPAPGRHPIIFGQRGVGKTSIANIIHVVFEDAVAVIVSCDGSDSFSTIWNRLLQNVSIRFKTKALGFTAEEATKSITLSELFGTKEPKSSEIAVFLSKINTMSLFILDEFDKISDASVKTAMAELIKAVSDSAPKVTIMIVGIADNINQLIGEHLSIERNLVHIEMPLMTDIEIKNIISNGFKALEIEIDSDLLEEIPLLCNGFPHNAHLLGYSLAKACAKSDTSRLTRQLFNIACNYAVEDAIEKYRDAYSKATYTVQSSRYPMVLCSCAFAKANDRGIFRATDVVSAVKAIFRIKLSIQAVVPSLGEFIKQNRGRILTPISILKRRCYKFTDPMMKPFLRIKANELRKLNTT